MKRKTLTLDDNPFDQFKAQSKTTTKVDKEAIEKVAEKQGFTKREPDNKKKMSVYKEQFNARCREGINDLSSDILYFQKIKKQELLEEALLAYLEKNKLDNLIAKYQAIISR